MLSREEQETIITFNKGDRIGHVFTYEKTWQNHFEKRLGLKPTMVNDFGGKEYDIEKSRIKMPHAKRKRKKYSVAGLTAHRLSRKS